MLPAAKVSKIIGINSETPPNFGSRLDLCGGQIKRKGAQDLTKFLSRNFGANKMLAFLF